MASLSSPIELSSRVVSRLADELRNAGSATSDFRAGVERASTRLGERAEDLQQQLGTTVDLGRDLARLMTDGVRLLERLTERADEILEVGKSLDAKAEKILDTAASLDAKATLVLDLGDRLQDTGTSFLDLGEQIQQEANLVHTRAEEVNTTAMQVVEVLPTMKQAVEMVQPLEGAVDRLGGMVDRLPGGRARRAKQGRAAAKGAAAKGKAARKPAAKRSKRS